MFKFWICIFIAAQSLVIGKLLPEWGISYNQIGYVYPNVERHFLSIDIELPTKQDIHLKLNGSLRCNRFRNRLIVKICEPYDRLLGSMTYESEIREKQMLSKLRDIDLLLSDTKDTRHKRLAILPFLTTISGIVGFVNQFVMRRKVNALESSLIELEKRNYRLNEEVVTLYDNQVTITQRTAAGFRKLEDEILAQKNMIQDYSRSLIYRINAEVDTIAKGFDYSIKVNTMMWQMYSKYTLFFQDAMSLLDDYYNGLIDLMEGKLPKSLISTTELKVILDKTADNLYTKIPEYVITE